MNQALFATDAAKLAPREARLTTILLIARLTIQKRDYLCRIRNLSAGGMLFETTAPVTIGEHVCIELKNGAVVYGVVVWAKLPSVGLSLDQKINVEAMLTTNPQLPKSLRLSTRCPVVLRRDGYIITGVLEDISQGGARITLSGSAKLDDHVLLVTPGLASRHATVKWVFGATIGVAFADQVAFADLTRWLVSELRFN
jgi:hypothetical protein